VKWWSVMNRMQGMLKNITLRETQTYQYRLEECYNASINIIFDSIIAKCDKIMYTYLRQQEHKSIIEKYICCHFISSIKWRLLELFLRVCLRDCSNAKSIVGLSITLSLKKWQDQSNFAYLWIKFIEFIFFLGGIFSR